MKVTNCSPINDVLMIEPKVYGDSRGYFMETYRAEEFASYGITDPFVQDNHSGTQGGVLRGLHYQIQQTQGKLVRVIAGEAFDVVVDLRKSSLTCGKWLGVYLSAENKRQLWIPPGLAHGFLVTAEWAEVVYKVTDYYAPQWERTLLWNDPQVGINWPLVDGQALLLSEKDKQGLLLKDTILFD